MDRWWEWVTYWSMRPNKFFMHTHLNCIPCLLKILEGKTGQTSDSSTYLCYLFCDRQRGIIPKLMNIAYCSQTSAWSQDDLSLLSFLPKGSLSFPQPSQLKEHQQDKNLIWKVIFPLLVMLTPHCVTENMAFSRLNFLVICSVSVCSPKLTC